MAVDCECGRGPVAVAVFSTKNRVLVRRLADVPHVRNAPPDAACINCAADAAAAVPVEFAAIQADHPDYRDEWKP